MNFNTFHTEQKLQFVTEMFSVLNFLTYFAETSGNRMV